jgi:guanylate kinase
MEMGHQDQFDVVLVNDDLSATVGRAEELVREHVEGAPQQPSLFERD